MSRKQQQDSLESSNHSRRSRGGSATIICRKQLQDSLRSSNHSSKSRGRRSTMMHDNSSRRHCTTKSGRRHDGNNGDNDNAIRSAAGSCCDDHYNDEAAPKKPSSLISLPANPPPSTAMFSNESLKLIYLSWDVIKNMKEGKQSLAEKLFELLSEDDVPISRWFVVVGETTTATTSKAHHQTYFVEMIDMLVSMLSPTDLDLVSEELQSLGMRHAQHNEELIQTFLPSLFQHFTDAFCKALKDSVHKHLFEDNVAATAATDQEEEGTYTTANRRGLRRSSSRDALFDDNSDELEGNQPSNWKRVEHAWQDLFWYIRCQMEEGAMSGYQQHEKHKRIAQQYLQHKEEERSVHKEYHVTLKSDDEEEVPLKGFTTTRRSSIASVNSSTSSISNDSSTGHSITPGSGSDASGTPSRNNKKNFVRCLSKRLVRRASTSTANSASSSMSNDDNAIITPTSGGAKEKKNPLWNLSKRLSVRRLDSFSGSTAN